MSLVSNDIKFCGFHPSLSTKKYILDKLDTILKEVPSSTTYNIILSKKDLTFKAIVTLVTRAKKYIAVAYGGSLDEVLRKIVKQIKKKFQKLKCPRFHREHINLQFHAVA